MSHREPKPATILAAVLCAENGGPDLGGAHPYLAAVDAEKLVRLGKRAARIALQRCNGVERYDAKAGRVLASWTEADETRADKAEARILKEAQSILQFYGATDIQANGDPRGYCLKWRFASGRSNSFGGGIWGV